MPMIHAMDLVRASIVIPVYGGVELTRQCVESLISAGLDARDELIVVDNASPDATLEFLATLESLVPIPVTVISNDENRNFAGACNQGAKAARGEYVLFLNNDTVVGGKWLDEMIAEAESSGAQIIGARLHYGDGRIQHAGVCVERGCFPRHLHRLAPADTPAARDSYDCQIVTGACMLVPRSDFLALGGFDCEFVNGGEDIDFCWRAREAGLRVRYCGRTDILHLESQSEGRNLRDLENVKLLNRKWRECISADAVAGDRIVRLADPDLPWKLETPRVVSVVIPVFNNVEDTRTCVESIFAADSGDEIDVIVVDNASTDGTDGYLESMAGRVRSIRNDRNYNFAGGCNQGAAHAIGEYIVFLNNDTIVRPGWWQALIAPMQRDDTVGATGGLLLYPDGTVQHAGVAFGDDRIGYHVHAGVGAHDPRVQTARTVQAVTGACLAMRRSDVIELQGFDQAYSNGCEDLDLCLRVQHDLNKSVHYEPACTIVHAESKSAGRFENALTNLARYLERWATTVVPDEASFGVVKDDHRITGLGGTDRPELSVVVVDDGVICDDAVQVLPMPDMLASEAGRINHALSFATGHEVAIARETGWLRFPHAVLEQIGGLDPNITNLDAALAQFAARARMGGFDLGSDPESGIAVAMHPRFGVHLPLASLMGSSDDVAFESRSVSVLVPIDVEDTVGSRAAVAGVLSELRARDDVTVVVRAGSDIDAALDLLEQIADDIDDLPDLVVIESDASADASLCAAVSLVVCEGRRGWALAGIARHGGATPIRVQDLRPAVAATRRREVA
jgi:GT2 family glycosyltransferase